MYRVVWMFLVLCAMAAASGKREVLVIIACPAYLKENCYIERENLRRQQLEPEFPKDYAIKVHIMHELFNYWTLLDALPHLQGQTRLFNVQTQWIIWCQQNTHVSSLRALLLQLQQQNATELAYYGHGLHDAEANILHHFVHYKNPTWFPYPMLSAGLIFTAPLLHRLAELVADKTLNATRHDFAIDAAHELARFIFDNLAPDEKQHKGSSTEHERREQDAGDAGNDMRQRKIILKSVPYICPSATVSPNLSPLSSPAKTKSMAAKNVHCLLHARADPATQCLPTSGSHIYFAIKTCAKFHKERIPIIERTWAADAEQRIYYSDVADVAGIPMVSTGIRNVDSGHCAKTLAILQLSLKDIEARSRTQPSPGLRWLALVDDDTLLSVTRLSTLLSCYNHSADIYVGERYGYRLHASDGFNYHTGGAGIVFSLPLVRRIVRHCSCPSATAPDDMILGYCLQALGVPVLHSPGFHQARPQDYAPALLQLTPPISFHKFWQTTPQHTYRHWLAAAAATYDNVSLNLPAGAKRTEQELLQYKLPELLHAAGLATDSKHLDL